MEKKKETLEKAEFLSEEAKQLLRELKDCKKKRIQHMKPIAFELEWRGLITISRAVAKITPAGEFAAVSV